MRKYQEITPEILEKLQQAAPGHVYTGSDINEDYSHDEMQLYGSHMPDVLIIPTSTEEISAVMKICSEYHVPVTTRGAGTAETGVPVPVYGGVLLRRKRRARPGSRPERPHRHGRIPYDEGKRRRL